METNNTQSIYVILSATPTIIGKTIRALTGNSFNHCSISLTEDWSEMYSFARYRAANPLVGGFVKEFPQRLSLDKDSSVYINVYEIPVNKIQYDEIKSFIYNIRDDKEKNIYNSMAALGLLFGWSFNTYKAYICTEFVLKVLLSGNIILENYTTTRVAPDEIQKMLGKYICFSGCLIDYTPSAQTAFDTNDFFKKSNPIKEIARTFYHFYSLIKRNT